MLVLRAMGCDIGEAIGFENVLFVGHVTYAIGIQVTEERTYGYPIAIRAVKSDDAMIAVLEDHKDDPVVKEITSVIHDMSIDEQVDLVALVWLGRGDGTLADWGELRAEAARAHNKRTAAYLLGMPLLSDYLEEALSQFGISIEA